MNKNILTLIFLVSTTTICWSQGTVTGKVIFKEENSEAPGVHVVEKGTQNGTQSALDGTFKLNVTDLNAVLVFSFIGVRTQEVQLNGKTDILARLKLDCHKDFFDSNEIHVYANSSVINSPVGGRSILLHHGLL